MDAWLLTGVTGLTGLTVTLRAWFLHRRGLCKLHASYKLYEWSWPYGRYGALQALRALRAGSLYIRAGPALRALRVFRAWFLHRRGLCKLHGSSYGPYGPYRTYELGSFIEEVYASLSTGRLTRLTVNPYGPYKPYGPGSFIEEAYVSHGSLRALPALL